MKISVSKINKKMCKSLKRGILNNTCKTLNVNVHISFVCVNVYIFSLCALVYVYICMPEVVGVSLCIHYVCGCVWPVRRQEIAGRQY